MASKPKRSVRRKLDPDDVRMTLGEHLEELRSRLIRAIAALLVGAIVCWVFRGYIVAFITWPIFQILADADVPANLNYLSPPERFVTDLKVSVIVGLIVSAPYSLTQIWGFVAAGLYPNERKWVNRFAPVSIGLFFTGAAFLLLVVSPMLLKFFLLNYGDELPDVGRFMPKFLMRGERPESLELDPSAHDVVWPTSMPAFEEDPPLDDDTIEPPPESSPWIHLPKREIRMRVGKEIYTVGHLRRVTAGKSNRVVPEMRYGETILFILHLAAAFGIGFQVPVVVTFLALVGIVEARVMGRSRRHIWFGMAVGAAMLTPPDIFSQLFLLVPMALLFEVGLFAARIIERRRAEADDA